MSGRLGLLRFYFVLLAIFTVGRWSLSLAGADYAATHQVFSIVILSLLASAHYGGFTRHYAGETLKGAAAFGAAIGIVSQLVILVSTALSYVLGMETFFNAPRALNVEEALGFGQAMGARVGGLVVNTILNTVAASLGWLIGAVFPKRS